MKDSTCIFCKIANGEIPSATLYEDEMFRVIQKGTGIQAEHLIASGNGLRRNPVLQEICSDMFGATLTLADYREEAACGAAVSSR